MKAVAQEGVQMTPEERNEKAAMDMANKWMNDLHQGLNLTPREQVLVEGSFLEAYVMCYLIHNAANPKEMARRIAERWPKTIKHVCDKVLDETN
jgi:hypothetical protein